MINKEFSFLTIQAKTHKPLKTLINEIAKISLSVIKISTNLHCIINAETNKKLQQDSLKQQNLQTRSIKSQFLQSDREILTPTILRNVRFYRDFIVSFEMKTIF